MYGVKFVRQNGGLSRELPGEDHISGLILYATTPTGQGSLDCKSYEQAREQGLLPADKLLHYHVAEFFRTAPGARLITQCVTTAATDYAEIKTLQIAKQGVIKQIGIWNGTQAHTAPLLSAINTACVDLANDNMPLMAYLSPKVLSSEYATLLDLRTLDLPNVQIVIGQDNSGFGRLDTANTQVGIIGATLGAVARSQVHTSTAWVEKQNMVEGFYKNLSTNLFHPTRELDVLGFLGDSAYSSFTKAQVDALDEKGYVFLRKYVGQAGSYFNHSRAATAVISDFAFAEFTRTMNKSCREVYKKLLPKLSSPAYIDPETGFITEDSVASLEVISESGLAAMERDGELSGYKVMINPQQNILSTSKLITKIRIVPVGVLRDLEVNIGFTLKINN